MQRDNPIAPLPVMVRYLAIFRRTFAFTADSADPSTPERVLLGGYLADALHNVPDMLWRYNEEASYQTPRDLEVWITQGTPHRLLDHGASESVLAECRRIVGISPAAAAEELHLHSDLANVDLAPRERLSGYLKVFYRALEPLSVCAE